MAVEGDGRPWTPPVTAPGDSNLSDATVPELSSNLRTVIEW